MHIFISLLWPFFSSAQTINCQYVLSGAPMASVEAVINEDGEVGPFVQVTLQGRTHQESATNEPRAFGESVHLWIAKQNPEQAIEMIVFEPRRAQGQSVLINHNVPFGKEIWGDCTFRNETVVVQ